MQQKLNISIFLERIYTKLNIMFEVLQGRLLKSKVGVIKLWITVSHLILGVGYPDNRLLKIQFICLNSLPQEGGQFGVVLLIPRSNKIKIVFMIFLLIYYAMMMECLELVTHHKALYVWLAPLYCIKTLLRWSLIVMNLDIGCPYSSYKYLSWNSEETIRFNPLISEEE